MKPAVPALAPALALALALSAAASCAAADDPGLKITMMHMPHQGAETRVAIWYPADGNNALTLYADSPVFQGVEAAVDAPIGQGKFPVVLFSHGMGGTDRAQAWLASALAERGAIVVMVNHPHSTWGDFDMSVGIQHWTRAADLSSALDQVEADPVFGPHIDTSRIMAAGFSYGGWTALSLGGLTGNLAGAVKACTAQRASMKVCDMMLSDKVSLQTQDPGLWNASHADPRVTRVAAIDPGFVWGLEQANTTNLRPRPLMIGLGGDDTWMLDTNFVASGLSGLLPDAQIVRLEPAFHFSAMPLCTPQAVAILEAENDDPVCSDPTGTDRAAVHSAIIGAILAALGL
jgi:predicted dienelactone hydrolase